MAECAPERPVRPPPPALHAPSDHSVTTIITDINKYHDKGYALIKQGLGFDEVGDKEKALKLYIKGLETLNIAIDITCIQPGEVADNARNLQQKMRKTRTQITSRLEELRSSEARSPSVDMPPTYEQATSPTSNASMTWADEIMEADIPTDQASLMANAEEMLSIRGEIQTYFISPEGYVSAPSYPSPLKIFKFTEVSLDSQPPAFIQVGDWTYPLSPNSSPVLQAAQEQRYGAYIFPDASTPGAAVGLILPSSVTREDRSRLTSLLQSLTAMEARQVESASPSESPAQPPERTVRPSEQDERTSSKIAKGVSIAADWISWGLTKGAEKTGQIIKFGSEKVKEKVKPKMEATHIDPKYMKGAAVVRQTAGVAVKVSGFLVTKLSQATIALGTQLAPHVRREGAKLIPKSVKERASKANGEKKVDDVLEVAASGLKGFGVVYNALESAAKSLFKSLADETVSIVNHRYGPQAAGLANNAIYTVGDTGMAVHNVNNLGIKAIAKRAAKDTGKEVVKDYANSRKHHSSSDPRS